MPTEVSPFLVESKPEASGSSPVLSKAAPSKWAQWSRTLIGLLLLVLSIPALVTVAKHLSQKSSGGGSSGASVSLTKDDAADHSTYNDALGNRTWILESIAGCDVNTQEDWSCNNCDDVNGVTNVTVIYDSDANLLMMLGFDLKYKQTFILYRGSEASNYPDYNLDFEFAEYAGDDEYCEEDSSSDFCCGEECLVHDGFQRGYYDLKELGWDKVKNYINYYSEYPVLVGGYSLGGAMAHHAVLDVVRYIAGLDREQEVVFYTHGSPRFANKDTIQYFENLMADTESNYYRIVWLHDIVPKLPPIELGYRHTGNEIWYYCNKDLNEDGEYDHMSCEDGDCQKCSDGHRIVDPIGGVGDHLSYFNYFTECDQTWYTITPKGTICDLPPPPFI